MRLFLLLLALTTAASAQPLAFEKVLDRYTIGQPEFSPAGDRIVFAVGSPVKGTARESHIWMYTIATKELRQLTHSTKSDAVPRWSPDGTQLAFSSTRGQGAQIYLLPMVPGGGEARPLTSGKGSVQSFAWSQDGHRIAYLASHPKSEQEEKKDKDKDDARVADHDNKPSQLWVAEVAGDNPPKNVPLGAWAIHGFVWRRDGGGVLAIGTTKPHSDRWEDSVVSIGISDAGSIREVERLKGPSGSLELSPDGRNLAYACARVDGPVTQDLCVIDPETGEMRNITKKIDRTPMSYKWQSASELLVSFADGFQNSLHRVSLDGNSRQAVPKGNFSNYARHTPSGASAYVLSSSADAPELWYEPAGGPPEQVTKLHAHWTTPSAASEMISYKSFDGMTIEGALLKPQGVNGPMPLAVLVHGGPSGRWADQFEPWGQLLVSRGIAVFYVNPRGSTGYGFDFLAANRADWGFGDFKDIMAGVDKLVADQVADPARIGIGGWSYGGYMAMWAVTQTNRFKCAVAGAGMSDLASEFGTEGGSAYDEWYFGTPYENLAKFQRSSPITYVKNAKTPTLILQGENDVTDPIGQSQQFYHALKLLGVTSELVLYPREGHGIREEKHMLDLYRRTVGWFEKYLKTPAGP